MSGAPLGAAPAVPAEGSAPVAAAAAAPAALAPPATAILVFVEAAGGAGPPAAPALLRARAAAALGAALASRGLASPLATEALSWQRSWRVRRALALPPEFVSTLAAQAGAQRLVVAQLVAADGRLLLAARSLTPATGLVGWADLADAPLPAAADTVELWRRTLPELAATLAERWREPPPRAGADSLGVLPVATLGCEPWEAEAATCALLRALIQERSHCLPDPGLLVASLQADGPAAAGVDADALRSLARRHGVGRVLISELQSLGPLATGLLADDAFVDEPSYVLEHGVPIASGATMDLVFAARLVAADDGRVVAAAATESRASTGAGWFGAFRAYSPARRLADAASDVWAACLSHREDS